MPYEKMKYKITLTSLAVIAILTSGLLASIDVSKGENKTNGDVRVNHNSNSRANNDATISPDNAVDADPSTITTPNKFVGKISGLEHGDQVDLGPNNGASVKGTGGTVSVGNDSVVTVESSGGTITVKKPDGTTVTVDESDGPVVIDTRD